MDGRLECFQPLLTQVNKPLAAAEADSAAACGIAPLPNGLGVLVRAGSSLRRALLYSLFLFLVDLGELAVLLLYPGPEVSVVWAEESASPLVEVP